MKILCVGQASYDITIPVDEFPIENTKNHVDDIIGCGGGTASNPAFLLGKWGMDVAFAGTIGSDIYGKKIIRELLNAHVDTSYIETIEGDTTISYILVNKQNGSRTVFRNKNVNKLSDLTLDFIPDIILTDGKEYEQTLKLIEEFPNAITVLDAGKDTEEITNLCYKVDYIVASKEFAEHVTKLKFIKNDHLSMANIYNLLYMRFKKNIVITMEEEGCLYKRGDTLKRMPTIKVSTIDTTGAGDFFHAGFIYGLAKGYSYEHILKIANVTASLSLRYLGSRNSVPDKREVKEIVHEFE